jgi:hypothetical protein
MAEKLHDKKIKLEPRNQRAPPECSLPECRNQTKNLTSVLVDVVVENIAFK